ncbi:hypothetical protein DCMF_11015 [Candidatus Formimonas warabiya]|uniref:Uncharacterized protein n=1 Tax=Formimonas warabiya TaxID=1761012 RepID=A0A3G1KS50_FORW1|nr:hypothetical protein DCMF_11015 [Candidatus Formimonas warabiya]
MKAVFCFDHLEHLLFLVPPGGIYVLYDQGLVFVNSRNIFFAKMIDLIRKVKREAGWMEPLFADIMMGRRPGEAW